MSDVKLTENTSAVIVESYDPVTGSYFLRGEFDGTWAAQEFVSEAIELDSNNPEIDMQFVKYRIVETVTETFVPRTELSTDEISVAVGQMKTYCDTLMADYKPVSARSALNAVNAKGRYDEVEVEQILQAIYDAGFQYCFDRKFLSSNGMDGTQEYPADSVCYWGPDQLKSRLNSIRTI